MKASFISAQIVKKGASDKNFVLTAILPPGPNPFCQVNVVAQHRGICVIGGEPWRKASFISAQTLKKDAFDKDFAKNVESGAHESKGADFRREVLPRV